MSLVIPEQLDTIGARYEQMCAVEWHDRGIGSIGLAHVLTPEDFQGKKIADLGCGMSDLQGDLFELGIAAEVIGYDARIGTPSWLKHRGPSLLHPNRREQPLTTYVQADLTALPVPDETFDMAIATFSLPSYATTRDHIPNFYAECRRILKVGGMLSIHGADAIEHNARQVLEPGLTIGVLERILEVNNIAMLNSPHWQSTGKHRDEARPLPLQVIKLS